MKFEFKKSACALAIATAILSLSINAHAHQSAAGEKITYIDSNVTIDEKVAGAFYIGETDSLPTPIDKTEIAVNTTKCLDDITGGYYSKQTKDQQLILKKSSLVIENVSLKNGSVIGGSKLSAEKINANLNTAETSTVINGGNIGDSTRGNQIFEDFVLGGDLLKADTGAGSGSYDAESSVSTANLTINGGMIDALVLGGSGVQDWYENAAGHQDNVPGASLKATVNTANININGGTFKENIYAGGYAMAWNGAKSISTVKVANLTIQGQNTKIEKDIYAGGLEETRTNGVSVEKANVLIKNVNIKNFYGYSGHHHYSSGEEHSFTVNKEKPVDTILTLQNASAASIDIAEGSVINVSGPSKVTDLEASGISLFLFDDASDKETTLTVDNFSGKNNRLRFLTANASLKGEGFKTNKEAITSVSASGEVNDALHGDLSALVDKAAGASGDYSMDRGEVFGATTGVVENGKVTSQITEKHETNDQIAELATLVPVMIARVEANDLRKRMGDLREATGEHGAWVRWDGGRFSSDASFKHNFNKVQIGLDSSILNETTRLGMAFSYVNGDTDLNSANADNHGYSLSVYGIWLGERGQFADVIARVGEVETDLETMTYSEELKQKVLSLSGEFGWRFDVMENFYFEPSIEAAYAYVDDDSYTTKAGNNFNVESFDSLVGRVGLASGFKCPSNYGNAYARVAVAHEFLGDSNLVAVTSTKNKNVFKIEGNDTWFEYAIGANINLNKTTYAYVDVERTEGAEIEQDWRATLGIRHAF